MTVFSRIASYYMSGTASNQIMVLLSFQQSSYDNPLIVDVA
jgi:hypothetical protein